MTLKHKHSLYLAVGLIVIVLVIIKLSNKNLNPEVKDNQGQPNITQTDNSKITTNTQMLTGKLQASDNAQRGNLMLITEEQTIYLYTSRDYAHLIDSPVNVEIKGTVDNFSLIDISAK